LPPVSVIKAGQDCVYAVLAKHAFSRRLFHSRIFCVRGLIKPLATGHSAGQDGVLARVITRTGWPVDGPANDFRCDSVALHSHSQSQAHGTLHTRLFALPIFPFAGHNFLTHLSPFYARIFQVSNTPARHEASWPNELPAGQQQPLRSK